MINNYPECSALWCWRRCVLLVSILCSSPVLASLDAKTLRVALEDDTVTLDPHKRMSGAIMLTNSLLFESLIDAKKRPLLAQSWELLSPLQYRFRLKEKVLFHSGNALQASDVCRSFDRVKLHPDFRSLFSGISSCTVVDDLTLDFQLIRPNLEFLGDIANLSVMDRGFYRGKDDRGLSKAAISPDSDSWAALNPSSTGPFRLVEHEIGKFRRYERFESYHAMETRGNVDVIEIVYDNDSYRRVKSLLDGELDISFPIPPSAIERIDSAKGFDIVEEKTERMLHLHLSQKNSPALEDLNVRKAIVYAVNQNRIVQDVLQGVGYPIGQFSAPSMNGHNSELTPRFNLRKSLTYLKTSDFPDGFELNLVSPNNRYMEDEAIARAVANMLAKIGVDVRVESMPKLQYWPRIRERRDQVYLLGWLPDSADSSNFFEALLACRDLDSGAGSFNLGEVCDPELEAKIAQAKGEQDASARVSLLRELERYAYENALFVPLHLESKPWGVRGEINMEAVLEHTGTKLGLNFHRLSKN